jgi:hypothetical protein
MSGSYIDTGIACVEFTDDCSSHETLRMKQRQYLVDTVCGTSDQQAA